VIKGDPSGISKSVGWTGGGSFVHCELAQANQNFIDRVKTADSEKTLKTIWNEMQKDAFLSYKIDPKTIEASSAEFSKMSLKDQKRFLVEVMDKNMLYVPLSEIEDRAYGISAEDKKLNHQFYG